MPNFAVPWSNLSNQLQPGLNAITEALIEQDKRKQEDAANNLILKHALDMKIITPEEFNTGLTGSRTQRSGIVAGAARSFAMQLQKQQADALEEQRQQRAALYQQQTEAFNFVPRAITLGPSGFPQATAVNPSEGAPPKGIQMIERRKGEWDYPPGTSGTCPPGKVPMALADGTTICVTGNKALSAQEKAAEVARALETAKTMSTPGVVTYWNDDYSKQLTTTEAEKELEDGKHPFAVMPDKTPLMFEDYKKMAPQFFKKGVTAGGLPKPTAPPSGLPTLQPKSGGKVLMKNKEGQTGYVPAEQVEAALAQGYTKAQ